MPCFVEIQVPGLPTREHELLQPVLAIGCGAEAEIRLPESSGLARRHVEIRRDEQGVRLALSANVGGALVFRGQECSEAFVPWGEEAYAGNVRLGFASRSKRAGSPLFLLLAPVLLLVLGMVVIPKLDTGLDTESEVEAPPLAAGQVRCREREPARAEHRAREAEHAGRAKMQRFAFVQREGIEAMDLLGESAACYGAADRPADAARVRAVVADWTRRMDSEYASARLRLRVALDGKRHRDALAAVTSLQSLLSARPASPYSEWLAGLQRKLERQLARNGS